MRIVVDTNVIVSALVFGGLPRKVLELAAEGVCAIYFSAPIQAEVERILEEKFGWSREASVAQTWFSRSAAFVTDRAQGPRTYKTGPRYSLHLITQRHWR